MSKKVATTESQGEAKDFTQAAGQEAPPIKIDPRQVKRAKMVGWHNPAQLLQTGKQVVISSILGRHADRRLLESLTIKAEYYDFSGRQIDEEYERKRDDVIVKASPYPLPESAGEVWIDYVSDVGDGWNPTYAVAHYLAQAQLKVTGADQPLRRGNLLIFGGDGVYPTADRDSYFERLQRPYECAFYRKCPPQPYAFALPGNHDWYDSLASFSEIFSSWLVRDFAGGAWRTPQSRSYFAARLPHDWWLLGVDVQLTHDIDEPQVKYFEDVIKNRMRKGDRVIFCCAEPFWVYYELADEESRERFENSRLYHLFHNLLKDQLPAVYLAGDLHHYYRVRDAADNHGVDGALRITAGGGGAFLHPTHGEIEKAYVSDRDSDRPKSYPDPKKSRELCNRNLRFWSEDGFLRKNWQFGNLTAILYLLTAWFMLSGVGKERRDRLLDYALEAVDKLASLDPFASGATTDILGTGRILWKAAADAWGGALFSSPFLAFLVAVVIAGFVVFTDTHKRWYRWAGGTTHAVAHLLSASFIGWLGCWVYVAVRNQLLEPAEPTDLRVALLAGIPAALMIALLGFIAGLFIMAFYLWFSLNVLGRHSNEAFSSLQIEDWKNFLRMKIDSQGELTVYPIGIDRVPRAWREAGKEEETCSLFVPDREEDPKFTEPKLIDGPLHYPPRKAPLAG
ncbi:MAG TPA: metallophosphoesterase [Blastocatellia bacterium]|nr:metallophosphoesterase [Blastocatellia bacterium]